MADNESNENVNDPIPDPEEMIQKIDIASGMPMPDHPSDHLGTSVAPQRKSDSLLKKRFRKFRTIKRGYYSLVVLLVLYIISFALPLISNSKALIVHYNGETYFPAFNFYPAKTFGQPGMSGTGSDEADYRILAAEIDKEEGNWIVMPLYPWDPYESDFISKEIHPQAPSWLHFFGTDPSGRDVFALMCYGFNVSISFALMLTFLNYLVGASLGGIMGFFGGKTDLLGQRATEIWANIPFLYTVIIVGSVIHPSFLLLVCILSVFGWIGISYLMRGEFLREKTKDYVAAAIALGAPDRQIIFKHILPNALTPMIAFLPFYIIGGVSALVSLDFLGYGLPPSTPSWGQMVDIGLQNKEHWWLVTTPLLALFSTLMLVTFVGEAIREAFDPKVYSRLR